MNEETRQKRAIDGLANTPANARLGSNGPEAAPDDCAAAREEVRTQAAGLIEFALGQAEQRATFLVMETSLIARVMTLARAVVVLFLLASERRARSVLESRMMLGGRVFRVAPAQARSLLTWFGVVRYRRTYLREVVKPGREARGFHPLDAALGLLSDRVSPAVLGMAVRLATRMSFKEACDELGWFLPTAPSVEVIEGALLGYGRHTQAWFAEVVPPAEDGEVLVIQIDSKGIPTATDEELRRRRGKRTKRAKAPSPRHRGRGSRRRRTKKPRRKKGDKAKNAKMGTMVVMYTLTKSGSLLLGPINKRYYASCVLCTQAPRLRLCAQGGNPARAPARDQAHHPGGHRRGQRLGALYRRVLSRRSAHGRHRARGREALGRRLVTPPRRLSRAGCGSHPEHESSFFPLPLPHPVSGFGPMRRPVSL